MSSRWERKRAELKERHAQMHERRARKWAEHRRWHELNALGHGTFRGPQLHVRLFWWFGASIMMMGAAAWIVSSIFGLGSHTFNDDARRMREFASGRFERVWHDEPARVELTEALARALDGRITLVDTAGTPLFTSGGGKVCSGDISFPVRGEGEVRVCFDAKKSFGRPTFLFALGAAGVTLWMASMGVARRIGRPLRDLSRVTREIGEGKLKSRARLGWRQPGELGILAESINDMAERIEKQLADEKELVAAVSHEIRAPLSRLRILTEIMRGKNVDGATLDKVEREIVEIDSLVGDLLASSRLDFSLTTFHPLDAREVAREAVEREGLPPEMLVVETATPRFEGDATLLARALSNLLDNATRHGGGAVRMRVSDGKDDTLVFAVDDAGPGFSPDVLPRAFQAFERGNSQRRGSTSLGLGLALVKRIAEAHGGAAWAENLPDRGARVAIRLSRRRPGPSADT